MNWVAFWHSFDINKSTSKGIPYSLLISHCHSNIWRKLQLFLCSVVLLRCCKIPLSNCKKKKAKELTSLEISLDTIIWTGFPETSTSWSCGSCMQVFPVFAEFAVYCCKFSFLLLTFTGSRDYSFLVIYFLCLQLEACVHPFFDELRDPNTRLPNGRPLPPLFNFKPQGEFAVLPLALC